MKGFTLLETLISCVILSALVFTVFQTMYISRESWATGGTTLELRQEIIKTFIKMEKELKETQPAKTDLASGDSSPSLTFRIPVKDGNNNIILNAGAQVTWPNPDRTITYALNGAKQITRTDSQDPTHPTVLANDISDLEFSRPISPVNILQIDLTVNKTSDTGRQFADSGQIKIKMRN